MRLTCLAERLGQFRELTPVEIAALEGLWGGTRAVRRGAVIRSEHERSGDMLLVASGWLFCSTLLEDGRRQIIRFHVRGDLLGGDVLAFAGSPDAITALTDAEIYVIDCAAFGRLFVNQPRLAALFYALQQVERVTLTDRLTSIGRSPAQGRVAALLLWVADRSLAVGSVPGASFILPMTQEEIGDATGLTAVHVNRTLRALEDQGLIERSRAIFRLIDRDRLALVANQPARRQWLREDWLPRAR